MGTTAGSVHERGQCVAVIELMGVRKSFRRLGSLESSVVLDGLDFVVPEGGVHGFLGPNGAGKTTSLRIMLGLVRADGGTSKILGRSVPSELGTVLAQVGALVDAPRLFPQWSGRYNLQVLAKYAGLAPYRVEQCLDLVGMSEQAETPFKGCSLGMKQRLGIAAAVLKDPRLLILDEPANGLDPAGIREIRDLVKQLGASGRTTVLVSSHQLQEVELMCDRVSILSRGRLVASGAMSDLERTYGVPDVVIRVDDTLASKLVLNEAGFTCEVQDGCLVVRSPGDPAVLNQLLAAKGHFASALVPQGASLESSFLELTTEATTARPTR